MKISPKETFLILFVFILDSYIAKIIVTDSVEPFNDEICDAFEISVKTSCMPVVSSNDIASNSAVSAPSCGNYNGADVWFKIVVPAGGNLVIEADTCHNGFTDGAMAVYSGNCTNASVISCDDNSGNGNMPSISLNSQSPGDTLYIRLWENGGNQYGYFSICAYIPQNNSYASFPYYTGFENDFDQYWDTAMSNNNGRIAIDTLFSPYAGNKHMTMSVDTSGNAALTEAKLHIDLSGQNDVKLSFWWKEFGDETNASEGIFASDDAGQTFTKIHELNGSFEEWTYFDLELQELMNINGLCLNSKCVIKFSHYDNWVIIGSNPTGGDGYAFDEINVYSDSSVSYSGLPYYTGFENGFDEYWSKESTSHRGRIIITGSKVPHNGDKHMTMDVVTSGYCVNNALLHLDLSSENNVQLNFWYKDIGDENHFEDGIWFSDNGGANFTKVHSLQDTGTFWQQVNLNVDAVAIAYNLNLNNSFVIKFTQYDNYEMDSDGMAFDDINITSSIFHPIIDVNPYALHIETDTNTTSYKAVDVINSGNDTLEIYSVNAVANFIVSPLNFIVNPGDTQIVYVDFQPDSVQYYGGTVKFNSNAFSGNDSLIVSGKGLYRKLDVFPASLDFDTILTQTDSIQNFYLVCTGNGKIRINDILTTSSFEILNSTSFNINPNDTHRVVVKFKPYIPITYNGAILIKSDVGDITISATGTGTLATSIEDYMKNEIEIYPNPANDIVFINYKDFDKIEIRIFNSLGENVLTRTINESAEIDVRTLKDGIYLMELIVNDNNEDVINRKIIVKR